MVASIDLHSCQDYNPEGASALLRTSGILHTNTCHEAVFDCLSHDSSKGFGRQNTQSMHLPSMFGIQLKQSKLTVKHIPGMVVSSTYFDCQRSRGLC